MKSWVGRMGVKLGADNIKHFLLGRLPPGPGGGGMIVVGLEKPDLDAQPFRF